MKELILWVQNQWNRLPLRARNWLAKWWGRLNGALRGFLIPMSLLAASVLGMVAVAYIADGRYTTLIRKLAAWGLMPGATGELTAEDVRQIGKFVGGGIGIALIFSTLKSVIDSIEPAFEFGKSWSKWTALVKPSLLSFLTVSGLMLVLVARPWETSVAARTIELSFETNVSPVATDDGLLRFVVPIAAEAGKDAARNPQDPKNLQVAPDDLYTYVLRNLATTLRHCVQGSTDRVVLSVVGFSSSSRWDEVAADAPDAFVDELAKIVDDGRAADTKLAFNLWVAERRAENVLQVLERQLQTELGTDLAALRGRFSFEAPRWASHEAMVDGVRIDDTELFNAAGLDDGGFLTRRVDVVVREAGACERVSLTSTAGA